MASTLGLRGTSMLAHGVASQAGIEEAQIATGDAFRNASLMLGTHLSPKLYVSYGVGLFETAATLRLRYLISTRWTIEAETAEQDRIDALYTVER
jgi:translocation and assembly module TamB